MKKLMSTVVAIATLLVPFTMLEVSADEAEPQLQAATVSASAGEDIEIPVELSGNPGIIALTFTFSYDTDVLELLSVEDCGLFADASFTPSGDITMVPFRLIWEDALAPDNYTDNGTMAILHFHVLDTAASGLSEVEINVEASNTFDVNLDDVYVESVNGGVEVAGAAVETTTTSTTTTTQTTTTTTTTEETTTTTEEVTTTTEEITTTTEEATTTTEEITTTTTTAVETTVTTEATTNYFASVDEMCEMALKDYEQKNGSPATKAEAITNDDGTISIQLTDEEGNILDTYVIDPVTGIGTGSDGAEVNLPQTGNNSLSTAATATAALVLTLVGAFAVAKSGVIRKKHEN